MEGRRVWRNFEQQRLREHLSALVEHAHFHGCTIERGVEVVSMRETGHSNGLRLRQARHPLT